MKEKLAKLADKLDDEGDIDAATVIREGMQIMELQEAQEVVDEILSNPDPLKPLVSIIVGALLALS